MVQQRQQPTYHQADTVGRYIMCTGVELTWGERGPKPHQPHQSCWIWWGSWMSPETLHGTVAVVFTNLFNISLEQATVPSCLKSATIIPVPKQALARSPNIYCPVALTPIVMNCFEQLVLRHIKSNIPSSLDEHQIAYRANGSAEDTVPQFQAWQLLDAVHWFIGAPLTPSSQQVGHQIEQPWPQHTLTQLDSGLPHQQPTNSVHG